MAPIFATSAASYVGNKVFGGSIQRGAISLAAAGGVIVAIFLLLLFVYSFFTDGKSEALEEQVGSLTSKIESLQLEINEKSFQLEKQEERHREEMEALLAVEGHSRVIDEAQANINAELETRNQQLQRELREFRSRPIDISRIDSDDYIILPREVVERHSQRNYDLLLTFIENTDAVEFPLGALSEDLLETGPPDLETDVAEVDVPVHPDTQETFVASTELSDEANSLFDLLGEVA